jgi:hypothetical protein
MQARIRINANDFGNLAKQCLDAEAILRGADPKPDQFCRARGNSAFQPV